MKYIQVEQGGTEWHAHRAKSRNASEAPAVMGASPYVSRNDLIRRKATGIEEEHDAATLARFAKGHEVEPALRALAEQIVGDDLYPMVAESDDGYLSASFDGVSMDESIIFEGKQSNASKKLLMDQQMIPPEDHWQIVHQFAVCGAAQKCIYLVGDGLDDTARMEILRSQIEADIPKLLAGWRQFDEDVKNYVSAPVEMPAQKVAVETLPAVSVQVSGTIAIASNLGLFGTALKDFIERINKKPETDEDFAAAESAIKTLEKAESALKQAKAAGLAQAAGIDELCRTVDSYDETVRQTRLMLEKLVKGRKEEIRAEIVADGKAKWQHHVNAINVRLGRVQLNAPAPDFAAAVKGKRTLTSLRSVVDDTLAKAKIEASEIADRITANLRALEGEAHDYGFLFNDLQVIAYKQADDFAALVAKRIADHKAEQARKLEEERERIRAEEEARAKREAEAKAEQERQRIREEEQAKAREDAAMAQGRAALNSDPMEKALADPKGVDGLPQSAPRIYADEPPPVIAQTQPAGRGHIQPQPARSTLADIGKPRAIKRPTDAEIIAALAARYAVDRGTVIEWIKDMDFSTFKECA